MNQVMQGDHGVSAEIELPPAKELAQYSQLHLDFTLGCPGTPLAMLLPFASCFAICFIKTVVLIQAWTMHHARCGTTWCSCLCAADMIARPVTSRPGCTATTLAYFGVLHLLRRFHSGVM